MPHTVIFSTSLNSASRSRILAREAHTRLQAKGQSPLSQLVEFYDLQEHKLPLYGESFTQEQEQNLAQIKASLTNATHILFAVPIYSLSFIFLNRLS